jgi:hypothetical protein
MSNKQELSRVIWTDVRTTLEATLYTGPSEGLGKLTDSLLRQVPTKDCDYTEETDLFGMSDFSWLQSALAALVAQTEDGDNYRKDYTDLLTRVFNCYTAKSVGKA